MKIKKGIISALIIGTVTSTYFYNQTHSEAKVITKQEPTLTQNESQPNKEDTTLAVTAAEINIIETMENTMPLPDYRLKYFQRQDGTGFFFQKVKN